MDKSEFKAAVEAGQGSRLESIRMVQSRLLKESLDLALFARSNFWAWEIWHKEFQGGPLPIGQILVAHAPNIVLESYILNVLSETERERFIKWHSLSENSKLWETEIKSAYEDADGLTGAVASLIYQSQK